MPIFSSSDKEEGSKEREPILGGRGSLEGQGARMWQSGPKAGVDCPEENVVPHHALPQSTRVRGPETLHCSPGGLAAAHPHATRLSSQGSMLPTSDAFCMWNPQ